MNNEVFKFARSAIYNGKQRTVNRVYLITPDDTEAFLNSYQQIIGKQGIYLNYLINLFLLLTKIQMEVDWDIKTIFISR